MWIPRELQPDERSAVEQQLAMIEERLQPAPRQMTVALITREMAHDHKERDQTEIQIICEDFAGALKDYSFAHIQAALREHRNNKNWFPKVAEIKALCAERRSNAVIMRFRAMGLLGLRPLKNWEIAMIERAAAERERIAFLGAGEAKAVDFGDRIAKLPPPLAAQMSGLMEAARKNEESREAPAE